MDNIIEPTENFDFSKISLSQPFGIQGGAYFTKIEYNTKPLYIQTSKTLTKQGFVKSGKKYYCDLMLDKSSEIIINWFEKLQETCQKLIYDKKNEWFQNSLEESDIENAFNAIIRVYKSGKYYLIRTNIKNSKTDEPLIKIYDESHKQLGIEEVNSETNVISIIEIAGIKFTSRNFQIDIDLKQMMAIDDSNPLFENCLIKTTNSNSNSNSNFADKDKNNIEILSTINEDSKVDIFKEHTKEQDQLREQTKETNTLEQHQNIEIDTKKEFKTDVNEFQNKLNDLVSIDLDLDLEELDNSDELKEVDLEVNLNNLETLNLKKPNQVYFEIYKEARNKAKIAKKNAILAFLEAKKIKNAYMLENINDSDSEIDTEIDEVSESELERL